MDKWILENRITTAAIAVLCVLGLLVYSNSGPKSFEECVIDNSKVGVKLGPLRSYCRKEFPEPVFVPIPSKCVVNGIIDPFIKGCAHLVPKG
jgi:hypothetical protein